MADFYLDTSAIGNGYQAYTDTPTTWGTPQDGNGKGATSSGATVPACEVTFAAVPTTGAITVYGVTVTLTGVLSAASTSAAATALASSINATTTACGTGVSALQLPLNRFVYARVKSGSPSTVEIMCRFCGTDLNFSGNASARVANTFNNSAMTSPVDFTGGTDGPWAYLYNTIGQGTVFGKTHATYGLMMAASPTPSNPGTSDVVWVRTRRSGVNITLTDNAINLGLIWYYLYQRVIVFDDGTKWSGDGGTFTLDQRFGNPNNMGVFIMPGTSGITVKLIGAKSDRTSFTWKMTSDVTSTSVQIFFGGGQQFISGFTFSFENAKLVHSYGLVSQTFGLILGYQYSGSTYDFNFRNCLFDWRMSSLGIKLLDMSGSGAGQSQYVMTGCEFSIRSLTSNYSLNALGANSLSAINVRMDITNNRFYDADGGGFKATTFFGAGSNSIGFADINIVDNEGIEDASPGFAWGSDKRQSCSFIKPDLARSHRYTNGLFTADWDALASPAFPTRNSLGPHGVAYSERISTTTNSSFNRPVQVFRSSKKYTAADAAKTITLELVTKDSDAWKKGEVYIDVRYINPSGQVVQESTKEGDWLKHSGSAAALAAGSGGWTGMPAGHSSTKLALTTGQSIKQNTEVVVTLTYQRSVATAFYVEPEFAIT